MDRKRVRIITDNSTETAFLQAIADNPSDYVTRLIYADWLDEHDLNNFAEFQRFVAERGGQFYPWPAADSGKMVCWHRTREENLLFLAPPEVPANVFSLLEAMPVYKGKLCRALYRSEFRAWCDLESAYLMWIGVRRQLKEEVPHA